MTTLSAIAVVIVTHDSEAFIEKNLVAMAAQTRPADEIILVDSGSGDPTYLKRLSGQYGFQLIETKNVGFCAANNIGTRQVAASAQYILYLNPDAFPAPDLLQRALAFMEQPEHDDVACVTGRLLGYDLAQDQPSGRIDSTGLFRKWYGRWVDRGQGEPDTPERYGMPQEVPAICGALMFCRRRALQQIAGPEWEVFDERFFMHKEDLDLSYRLREAGWRLMYDPALKAHHCRGFGRQTRRQTSRTLKLMAARNEVRFYLKHPSPYLLWALLKWAVVAGVSA